MLVVLVFLKFSPDSCGRDSLHSFPDRGDAVRLWELYLAEADLSDFCSPMGQLWKANSCRSLLCSHSSQLRGHYENLLKRSGQSLESSGLYIKAVLLCTLRPETWLPNAMVLSRGSIKGRSQRDHSASVYHNVHQAS